MNNSFKLSPKHGINPSLLKCFICGKDIGFALLGKLKNDAKAPKEMINGELCEECQKILDAGNKFILEVKDSSSHDNLCRTGRLIAVSGDYADRVKDLFELDKINYMEQTGFEQLYGRFFEGNSKEQV